ncbi:cytochrome c oxidase assembly factor 5 [Pipistrellus kuhlii]|nr:cytochrome c oxidase assembly factor 5 [Pipistrellus kuhlii]
MLPVSGAFHRGRRRWAAGSLPLWPEVARPRRAAGAAMPRYYEDKPEGGACAGVKEDLGACLLQSRCVLQEGKSPRQCLKEGNCKALKNSFFECKRSMLDARSRFRGRKGY